jgi:hypothetical protein
MLFEPLFRRSIRQIRQIRQIPSNPFQSVPSRLGATTSPPSDFPILLKLDLPAPQ